MTAPALLALTSAGFLLPARVVLYAQPGSAAWDGAHGRWALLLGLALAAFAAASRDPAHRRPGGSGFGRRRRGRARREVSEVTFDELVNLADDGELP